MLVIPDTSYHTRFPVLLGYNVLSVLGTESKSSLHFSWRFAFNSLAKQQTLQAKQDSLGASSTTKPGKVRPRGKIIIHGPIHVQAVCNRLRVCLEESIWT